MADIVRGRYRHFKGGVYFVLGTATHSETGEELVIYHKAGCGLFVSDEEQKLWARPAKMWNETVFRHGSEKQRFELLNTIPATDVLEVVRCRDCKHNGTRNTRQFYQWCDERHEYHVPDWFCADGEPLKDGGQDDGN